MPRVAEGALLALGEAAAEEFEQRHGQFPRRRVGGSRPRPVWRSFADPRLRPRPHLSAHAPTGRRCLTAPSRSGQTIISTGSPAGSQRRSASRPPPARSTTSTRGCGLRAPRACWWSRSMPSNAISASEAWTWEHMALCRARPLFGSDDARGACAAADRRRAADAARLRRGRRRCRQDACGDRAPQAAARAARREARPRRARRPRIRGPRAPADQARRPEHAAGSGARGARGRIFGRRQTLSMR